MGEEHLEFYPIGDKILLRKIEPQGSKIVVVSSNSKADERVKFLVLRVGSKVTDIKVGDIIAAGPSCLNAKYQGQDLFLAEEKGIYCVVRNNPEASGEPIQGVTVQSEK